MDNSNISQTHIVLFPFMSKGHTIPILHLAHLLLRRHQVSVTVFTTPANRPFIGNSLKSTTATIIDLPFPQNIPELPPSVESTDKLPSMKLFPYFALATQNMQPHFEDSLKTLPPVTFMVSDGFLWWTLDSALKFKFPRLVFYGMCAYATCVSRVVAQRKLLFEPKTDVELVTVKDFPWIKVCRQDFDPEFSEREPKGPQFEFIINSVRASELSDGYVVNSFYELEPFFVDYWNQHFDDGRPWCVGPLCMAEEPITDRYSSTNDKPLWIEWLDKKLEEGNSVLYIAFGSQAQISTDQLKEIAFGLEESNANFLWVTRTKESELDDGFEERVKEKGIIVREWVDQREILNHNSVQGFLSHCGWNSVTESICEGVPILAWPMMAEQPLNARMVAEELKIGLRVETYDGSVRGFVKKEALKKMVNELMEGEGGKMVRKRAKECMEMAKLALKEGSGSSWRTLNMLINEMHMK